MFLTWTCDEPIYTNKKPKSYFYPFCFCSKHKTEISYTHNYADQYIFGGKIRILQKTQ